MSQSLAPSPYSHFHRSDDVLHFTFILFTLLLLNLFRCLATGVLT